MIHAVVVAYKSAEHIGACVEPLLDDELVTSMVVVDNSSDPATERVCRRWNDDPRLEYLPSENIGYAAACNLGASRAHGTPDFLAVVNPDVALRRPLSELAQHSMTIPGTVFSARLDQSSGINARPMAGPVREVLNALVGSRVYRMQSRLAPGKRFVRVPQIDGSLLLVPSREATALGGFDERFELYYEDVDYCRRANLRAGCHLLLESWGSHPGGASFSIAGEPPFITLRVSRMRYLRKWYGALGMPLATFIAVLEFLVRTMTGHAPSRRALVRALAAQLREVVRPAQGSYLA